VLLRDFLESSAELLPKKLALVCGRERHTYAELDARADRLAQSLIARGVRPGDRVVIHLPNSVAAVVSIFAALKTGAIFVPVNATTKAEKLAFILNNCRAAVLISELQNQPVPQTPWLKTVIAPGLNGSAHHESPALLGFEQAETSSHAKRPVRRNADDDLACLIYTSGSTGQPKGVMCEERNMVFASGSIIQYLENTEADIVLNVLPLSFDYGLYQLLMTFRFGGTLILENSFAFPLVMLQRIAEEHVTGLPGVPTIFTLLLGLDLRAFDLSSLRYLTNTAAALPPNQVLELRRKFPRAKLFSMYGLTETKRALYLPPDKLEQRPGSVGIPIPGTEAWLEDEEGRRLAPGKIGELVIRGPHVMRGYWENPEATAKRFHAVPTGERLCYSGDLFRQDDEGYFYFVGRKDDIIKSRGEKVAPKEIENVLYNLPGVAEAAVIGVPDPILGQSIKAFIVTRKPMSEMRVRAHCRASLEDFMMPREIEFRDTLPKNASGKIDKLALASEGPSDCIPVNTSALNLETRN